MSVTAVPLQPIRRGSVRRFWLAIVLVLAIAAVLAWAGSRQFGQTASGLRYQMIEEGTGETPTSDHFAMVGYKGMLPDGTMFDENPGMVVDLAAGGTIPGFGEAVTLLRKGGSLRAWIPAELAYGANPPPGGVIPANSPLVFEIKLLEFRTRAEIMENQRMMQLQQMLQQQGGAPTEGGPPPQLEGMPPAE